MFFQNEPEEIEKNQNFVNWNFDIAENETTSSNLNNDNKEGTKTTNQQEKTENSNNSNKTYNKFKDMFSDSEA